ncbi:MAG: sigma factor-like helix-turn-helix DNA-binding protein [Candidatus Eremiobacteraeota bacterium]|nr:sigma factor-like helix-turn-helix DNA-binding protein [Candidatus Eremiobacteraeota bacterium]
MSKEPSHILSLTELIDCVNSTLDRLDFIELVVLRYYLFEELRLSEISERLKIPVSQVKKILAKSFAILRSHIGEKYSREDIISLLESF